MKEWMKIVPAEERKAYESGGFMGSQEIGKRTALIVVDVTYGFTGSPGLTLQEAIKEFGPACGPASWEAMPRIAQLIAMFRDLGRPVGRGRRRSAARRHPRRRVAPRDCARDCDLSAPALHQCAKLSGVRSGGRRRRPIGSNRGRGGIGLVPTGYEERPCRRSLERPGAVGSS